MSSDGPSLSKFERFKVRDDEGLQVFLKAKAKAEVRARRPRLREPFVLVAMTVRTIERARRAHSAAPVVLLAIKRAYDMKGLPNDAPLAVTEAVTAGFGIPPGTRVRAIKAMVAAGLMVAEWGERRAPRVTPAPWLFGNPAL